MKQAVIFPLRLLVFWLLFFAAFRLWFILMFPGEWSPEHPGEVWKSFFHALPLDGSMAGYLMVIPVLTFFAGIAAGEKGQRFLGRFITWFNLALIAVLVMIFGANVFIYSEWHTLLNYRAIAYMSTPSALFDSISWAFTIGLVLLYVAVFSGSRYFNKKWVGTAPFEKTQTKPALAVAPVWLALVFLLIRGGWGTMPINESAVYYSPHLFNNHAATNPCWNLIHSYLEIRTPKNNYKAVGEAEIPAFANRLLAPTDSLPFAPVLQPLNGLKPNIVFIVMESMTAQVVEELGGEPGVCPNLSRLIKSGVLFENCYGSGYRTDQGLVSVLAGFPAQPDQSVILQSEKAIKLNAVSKILKEKANYKTAFYCGAELTFANIGVWLTNERFEKIVSEKDFSTAELTQRWGADDRILLLRTAQDLEQMEQPFFATALTLSLHPPFDVPYKSRWNGSSEREQFLNSAAFADDAIGSFFSAAEKMPWFSNTVFVLVADHGSSNPGGLGLDNPRSRHIPLIVYSPLLRPERQGTRIRRYCHSHDIPATVLSALNFDGLSSALFQQKDFPWSRNLWAEPLPGQNFSYYTNENGLGWVTPEGKSFYRFNDGQWQNFQDSLPQQSREDARVYLQMLYDTFLGL